jgi:hypothetical protein
VGGGGGGGGGEGGGESISMSLSLATSLAALGGFLRAVSVFLGAFPPVDLKADCWVLAIAVKGRDIGHILWKHECYIRDHSSFKVNRVFARMARFRHVFGAFGPVDTFSAARFSNVSTGPCSANDLEQLNWCTIYGCSRSDLLKLLAFCGSPPLVDKHLCAPE